MQNILSIDVESWVHFYRDALKESHALSSSERKALDAGYVREAIEKLLNLLAKHRTRATFFVVSEIYDWYPDTVEKIERAGHEVGHHTHQHQVLTSAELLQNELDHSTNFLGRFHPKGFRAPHIILPADAYPLLKKNGFLYSSSTYDHRGKTVIADLDEIPVSTLCWRSGVAIVPNDAEHLPRKISFPMLSHSWPVGSGLSLGLGSVLMGRMIRTLNKQGRPLVLFVHPWQLYDHPKIRGSKFFLNVAVKNPLCLPYMINVSSTLESLLREFEFVSFEDYYYNSAGIN